MNWANIKLPDGCKLFRIHKFSYMSKGINYVFEINEVSENSFIGYGEQATDSNSVLETVNGDSIESCLNGLIANVEKKS